MAHRDVINSYTICYMKKIVLTTYGKMIALLMSLLGFIFGCGTGIDPIAEYGVPSADFRVRGEVKSAATGNTLPGIRMIVREPYTGIADTSFTDAGGVYSMEIKQIIGFPVTLYAEDIDGEVNGLYMPDSMVVRKEVATQIRKGNNSWYDGVYEKKGANFSLKALSVIPMYGVRSVNEKE